jgi:hypothetical protein
MTSIASFPLDDVKQLQNNFKKINYKIIQFLLQGLKKSTRVNQDLQMVWVLRNTHKRLARLVDTYNFSQIFQRLL